MKNIISKATAALALPLAFFCSGAMTSCADMLDTDSELVQFAEDNKLNAPEDSLFSVMGIIRHMQIVADRTVLLGEVRGDLVAPTDRATTDIKNLAAFNFSEDNKYNQISDYYAIINDCNFFIANADMNLKRLGKVVFEREMTAIKSYRAWTYLQLAKIYGAVPLVLEPVLTEVDAQREMEKTPSGINEICEYFINDIKADVDNELPMYGHMGVYESDQFFIPVRVLLGDLCLWAGRYSDAAQYLADYLTFKNRTVKTGVVRAYWGDNIENFSLVDPSGTFGSMFSSSVSNEVITLIPMEDSEINGIKSNLSDIFSSTNTNLAYAELKPSAAMIKYSTSEDYTYVYDNKTTGKKDTIYVQKDNLRKNYLAGDLRLQSVYTYGTTNRNEFEKFSSDYHYISKYHGSVFYVPVYRIQQVYLMFAEALNRAGFPESAVCILKYGLREQTIERVISEKEREAAAGLLNFSDEDFTEDNTQGIHSRGCGRAECDVNYVLPLPETELPSYEDSVQYQIPLVEDMIMREMTLEKAFEGQRYYDLMRIALRRNDTAYLAKPIANRTGEENAAILSYLMDRKNWYLPIK